MAHSNVDHNRGNSISTLILITVILLGLLYMLANSCTNHGDDSKHATGQSAASHG